MSKNVKETDRQASVEEKKIQTKYDRKVQRRKEEAERARKEKIKNRIISIVVILLIVAFVASFPIRKALALHAPYITINGETITQVEFDYNRSLAKANFLNQNSAYFSMLGLDMSTIDTQMYNENMTFAEYFDQLATEQIIQTKALRDAAQAEGFVYDATADYEETIANVKEMAEEQDISYKEYFQMVYGSLSTESRLEDIMKENLYALAYCEKIEEEKSPSDADIVAYYEANKASYDSVDYHMTTIKAELPTTAPDGTVPTDEEGNEVAYQPTGDEIAAAMAEAKEKAEAARETVAKDGEVYTNVNEQESYVHDQLRDFLFDESTKPGDTYVAENTVNNNYLVASFDGRYLDETPTESARIIISTKVDSQTILDEWKAGAATEDSFIELVNKYDEAGSAVNDGLYEGISDSLINADMYAWLSAPERKTGDTFAMNIEEDANYVLYYVGKGDPKWKNYIRESLLTEAMTSFLEELTGKYTVEDSKGKLKYLTFEETTQE